MNYSWLSLFAGMLIAALVTALLSIRAVNRQKRVDERIWDVTRSVSASRSLEKPVVGSPVYRFIDGLGAALLRSGIISESNKIELMETLANTRKPGEPGLSLSVFIAFKVSLFVGIPIVVSILGASSGYSATEILMAAVVTAIIGLLAPDMILKRLRKRYLDQVERGLPDALDLLVICAEAGLGLEPAIERVSEEVRDAHEAISRELVRTSQDMRMFADREQALENIGKRTGLESMKRLAMTLVQSTKLGTPLTRAFRTIAAELRQEALTRYEERAARLPVLLTVPMILFILPCVFIVVAGPAGVQVYRQFH